jgi:hypothetical protein
MKWSSLRLAAKATAAGALIALLTGCAPTVISLPPYTPVTTAELDGGVDVTDFKYSPKSKVPQNVIHNTAAGKFQITENVGTYIGNAVRREFRQAGISLKPESKCYLEGEVNDLTIDDLGFSATYISDIRYILWTRDQKSLLDHAYTQKFDTTKFVVAEVLFANLNKVISSNVSQLMDDPTFRSALEQNCPKP